MEVTNQRFPASATRYARDRRLKLGVVGFRSCNITKSKESFKMADQVLKDARGFTIGKISTSSSGVHTIKDKRGFTKGTYDPKTNKTKDARGFSVGTGNLLTTLL